MCFDIPQDTSLVCLVGENGSGKSNLLELIAAVAHRVGLSSGIDSLRGDPLETEHELSVVLSLPRNPGGFFGPGWNEVQTENWSGVVRFSSRRNETSSKIWWELGMKDGRFLPADNNVGGLSQLLRRNEKSNYLYLDANRSYPHVAVPSHQFGEIVARNWESQQWGKSRAHLSTNTLYQEWIQYLVATESQAANRLLQLAREAAEANIPRPNWADHFSGYKSAILEVLSHLRFVGVTNDHRILFDSAGVQLNFYQLSGGEREIAFLIGQVFRFRLERGLFLIDEPELHLNADLLRLWVRWLRDRVTDGQTWLATHSMEAAEIAGSDSVFVLKRTPGDPSRRVTEIQCMLNQPVLQTLSKALGSPAFSIADRKFVWIEGEPSDGERARFHAIFSDQKILRFLEAGNCHDVVRRVEAIRAVSEASGHAIRVTGIIDRDFKGEDEIQELEKIGLHVLPTHEIENLLIHPATLTDVAAHFGQVVDIYDLILKAADDSAGRWVFQRTCASGEHRALDLHSVKRFAGQKTWADIDADGGKTFVNGMISAVGKGEVSAKVAFSGALGRSITEYGSLRQKRELWSVCMGKEAMHRLAKPLGLASADALERAVIAAWTRNPALRPEEFHKIAKILAAL